MKAYQKWSTQTNIQTNTETKRIRKKLKILSSYQTTRHFNEVASYICVQLYICQVIGPTLHTMFMHYNNLLRNCRNFDTVFPCSTINQKLSAIGGNW